jgi:hypothetical protein
MKTNYRPAESYQAEFQKADKALVKEVLCILFVCVLVGAAAAAIHFWG